MASDVDLVAHLQRIGAFGGARAEVRLSRMNRRVSRRAQQRGQQLRRRLKAMDLPLRLHEPRMRRAGVDILVERPVGDVGSRGRLARDDRRARRRAHGRGGVGVGEAQTARREFFEIWRVVARVESAGVGEHRHRNILLAEVVHKKEHDVGSHACARIDGRRIGERARGEQRDERHGEKHGDAGTRTARHAAILRARAAIYK